MRRVFCDVCDTEIERSANRTIMTYAMNGHRIGVDLMVSLDDTWNGGDICLDCIITTVSNGKGRQP